MEAPIVNPPVPYIGYVNNGFRGGRLVRVQGRINHNSHGFKIELLCGPNPNHDDVALHLNPRFSENVVIRNSRNYSSWGTEERHGSAFPFVRGQAFEILILCEPQHFKIAINGQHYAEFNHRVPVERITHLTVDGDITIALVQFDGASSPLGPTAPQMGGPSAFPPGHGYDPSYGSAQPGFVPPPYPPNAGGAGIPAYPPQSQAPYSTGYAAPPPGAYPPSSAPSYPPQHGAYPSAAYGGPGPGQAPYAPQHPGAYPSQPGGYYQGDPQYPQGMQQGYPGGPQQGYPGKSGGGGLMGSAGKLLAGVGLAGVASKIPGLGGHGGHGGGGHGGGGHSSGGFPGGVLGGAGALGLGGALAAKVLKPKKMKKNKMGKAMKYGIPLAGVGLGGYALHKGMHGFRRGSRSSSSSSGSSGSSEEE